MRRIFPWLLTAFGVALHALDQYGRWQEWCDLLKSKGEIMSVAGIVLGSAWTSNGILALSVLALALMQFGLPAFIKGELSVKLFGPIDRDFIQVRVINNTDKEQILHEVFLAIKDFEGKPSKIGKLLDPMSKVLGPKRRLECRFEYTTSSMRQHGIKEFQAIAEREDERKFSSELVRIKRSKESIPAHMRQWSLGRDPHASKLAGLNKALDVQSDGLKTLSDVKRKVHSDLSGFVRSGTTMHSAYWRPDGYKSDEQLREINQWQDKVKKYLEDAVGELAWSRFESVPANGIDARPGDQWQAGLEASKLPGQIEVLYEIARNLDQFMQP